MGGDVVIGVEQLDGMCVCVCVCVVFYVGVCNANQ